MRYVSGRQLAVDAGASGGVRHSSRVGGREVCHCGDDGIVHRLADGAGVALFLLWVVA